MTLTLKQVDLVLYFTGGMSLRTWDQLGMLDREVALYKALRPHLNSITFVTYGDSSELDYKDRIGDINVICNRWRLPQRLYMQLLKTVYPRRWKGSTIFKSNQINGAQVALGAAKRCHGKFIARCGYLFSDHMVRQFGADSKQAHRAMKLESMVFPAADRVVVSTPDIRDAIAAATHVSPDTIKVVPNYVDTSLFRPDCGPDSAREGLLFIGRFTEQKNIFALLEAITGLDLKLTLVGTGELEGQLQQFALDRGLSASFVGIVPHRQLPELLRRSSAYVLPSNYEGHPKSLLEAMACGTPVVGTDVRGIREVIRHEDTGLLCGTRPEEIRQAVMQIASDPISAARMAKRARQQILNECSLDTIVQMELETLESLATT